MSTTRAPPVEVRPHPQKRRGLYATSDFASGDCILSVMRLVASPASSVIRLVCTHCLSPGEPRACTYRAQADAAITGR